jgi:hypothetical protein
MKIKRIIILFSVVFPMVLQAQHQDVIASSGGLLSGSNGSMSFTLGESVVSTFNAGSVILTQGFQQPTLIVTGIDDGLRPQIDIEAYPNPVVTSVTLKAPPDQHLRYLLYDMNGVLIAQCMLVEAETEIDFENLPAAVYIVKVYKGSSEVKAFKIVKR